MLYRYHDPRNRTSIYSWEELIAALQWVVDVLRCVDTITRNLAGFQTLDEFAAPSRDDLSDARDVVAQRTLSLYEAGQRRREAVTWAGVRVGALVRTGRLRRLRNGIAHEYGLASRTTLNEPYVAQEHWDWLQSNLDELRVELERDLDAVGDELVICVGGEQWAQMDEMISECGLRRQVRIILYIVMTYCVSDEVVEQYMQQVETQNNIFPRP